RAGAPSRTPGKGDGLSLGHLVALFHQKPGIVGIGSGDPFPVVDGDEQAVPPVPAADKHHAAVGRLHRGAGGDGNINPGMKTPALQDGVSTPAKGGTDAPAGGPDYLPGTQAFRPLSLPDLLLQFF